ncbi:MAG: sialidase family protein [Actinomycetota bacterium]
MIKRLLVVVLALSVFPMLPSGASDPSSGTVSATVSKLAYDGAEIGVGSVAELTGPTDCVEGVTCDSFALTVDVPEGFYTTAHRTLTATITWTDTDADLNFFLCSGTAADNPNCVANTVSSSAADGGTSETIVVKDLAPGDYQLVAKSMFAPTAYKGVVTFLDPSALPAPKLANFASASGAFGWESRQVGTQEGFAEPSIDVDHSNVMYVTAPGGAGVQMWRSFDYGKTFEHSEVGSDGGGGDSEIEFLSNDVALTADLRITDSAVSRSEDRFKTFTQQGVGIEQDRQWLAHRCAELVLLGYHDFIVEAEMVNRSTDGGLTWEQEPIFISPSGSAPGMSPNYADQGINTFSGPLAVDQKTGDVYIVFAISTAEGNVTTGIPPFGSPQQIVVGVSHDEAQTWELKLVEAADEVGPLAGLIFPWITVDRDGNVYVTWAGRDAEEDPINVFLSYSNDHGETFSEPYRVNNDATGHVHIYTTVSGGDPGVVDMAWYTASTADPASADNEWYVDFAQIRSANTASPQISQSRVFPNSIHHGEVCLNGTLCAIGGDRSLLDFFQIQVGPDGMANIAFANNGYPADNTPDDSTDHTKVWYARQTSGQSAGNGLLDTTHCPKAAGGPGAYVRGLPVQPKPKGDTLPGTGVGGSPLVAWVLLGAAVALGGRLRFAHR